MGPEETLKTPLSDISNKPAKSPTKSVKRKIQPKKEKVQSSKRKVVPKKEVKKEVSSDEELVSDQENVQSSKRNVQSSKRKTVPKKKVKKEVSSEEELVSDNDDFLDEDSASDFSSFDNSSDDATFQPPTPKRVKVYRKTTATKKPANKSGKKEKSLETSMHELSVVES